MKSSNSSCVNRGVPFLQDQNNHFLYLTYLQWLFCLHSAEHHDHGPQLPRVDEAVIVGVEHPEGDPQIRLLVFLHRLPQLGHWPPLDFEVEYSEKAFHL